MNRRIVYAMAGLAIGAAPAAQADSNWLGITAMGWQQTPGWFVAPGIEGGIQRLPRWNSSVSTHSPVVLGAPQIGLFNHTPDLAGVEAGLTIGYVFRDGALPAWLGTRVRVGLTGTWQSFSDTASSDAVGPASALIQYIGVDGRNIGNTAFPAGSALTETLRINRQGFDLNLRMASDFPLRPGWTLTPSIAAFGGRVHDTYNYRHNLLTGPVTFDIDERVRTTSIGGDVSAGLTWQATSALALNFTARGGVVWMRSRLEGTDCFGFLTVSCVPAIAFVGSSTGTVSDSRSRVGFRGGASLGAALDMRFGILTLGGSFTYDSAIPGVSNPNLALVSTTPGLVAGPARIRFADGFRYAGFATLRIPLLLGM